MPKVSVIVPVYKVEKYVSRCIESILNQIYTDWELILVDDGSPDSSGPSPAPARSVHWCSLGS